MSYISLGKSQIKISKVIMGTWQAGKQMWTGIHDSDSLEAIKTAYEKGITTFDTAEMYGKGHSEQILGKAIKDMRNKVVLATKAAPHNLSDQKIRNACERSLKNLSTDYIDLYQIHWPAGSFGSKKIPIEETLNAMNDLKKQGKIRSIGVSNFSLEQLKEALNFAQIDSIQPPYSILWRGIEDKIMPFCEQNNISILAYSSLAQGLLTGKFTKGHAFEKGDNRKSNMLFSDKIFEKALDIIDHLKPIASDFGMSLAELAICWVTSHNNTAALTGARNSQQTKTNAMALNSKLPEDIIHSINEASNELKNIIGDKSVMWQ